MAAIEFTEGGKWFSPSSAENTEKRKKTFGLYNNGYRILSEENTVKGKNV